MSSNYTVEQIENYGKDVQIKISDELSSLLSGFKNIDLGETGEYLTELNDKASSISKKLNANRLVPMRAKKWLAKYEQAESSIASIENCVTVNINRRNVILNGLVETRELLKDNMANLEKVETELSSIVEEIKSEENYDEILLQAATHRLKMIAMTNELTRQEFAKTTLQIMESKELTYQLEDVVSNLLPIFRTMMMNCIAERVNRDSLALKKSLIEAANKLVIDSAHQIERTADELIAGRTDTLISPENLMEASNTLKRTVEKIIAASKTESSTNIELVNSLKSTVSVLEPLNNNLM